MKIRTWCTFMYFYINKHLVACNQEFLRHIEVSLSFSWKFCVSPPPFLFIFVSIDMCVFSFPVTCCKSVLLSLLPSCHMICTPRHETMDHSNLYFEKQGLAVFFLLRSNYSIYHHWVRQTSLNLITTCCLLVFISFLCVCFQEGAHADGQSKTKQESAWLFRLWYTFDHKYPFCFFSVVVKKQRSTSWPSSLLLFTALAFEAQSRLSLVMARPYPFHIPQKWLQTSFPPPPPTPWEYAFSSSSSHFLPLCSTIASPRWPIVLRHLSAATVLHGGDLFPRWHSSPGAAEGRR